MVSLIALAIVPTLAFATTTPELDRLRTGLADAKADLADAEAAVDDAQADVDSIVGDPGTNAGHKEWTAYGFFQSIRDNASYGSAAYWDAQCAMDILDGGVNTTGHSYAYHQGPAPDGYGASKWASIASNIAWDKRGDAVGLDNMRVSIELLREFNDVRAMENEAEGTSLRTDIGTNCRQMAISIVQCDTSKSYSISHTQAYEGLENLSWSSAAAVPNSWGKYTDPYVGWYEEEKVNYQENNGGVTGHYTTIVDLNSGYFCELAGFAVCQYGATYGECRELSTFGDFFDYDTNPTPEQIYSLDEFEALFEAYYDEQVEACMFGTPDHVIEEYQSALSTAEENRTKCENAVASWEQELEDYTDISTNPNVEVSFDSMTYTGAELTPKPTVKVDGVTLEEGTDYYSANYRNNVHAGTGQMQIEATNDPGTGKWHGVREASFTITPKNISGVTVTLEQSSYTYDGTAKKPGVTVKDGSKTLVEGTHYTLRYANNTNAGTANVTIEGNGDYFRTKAAFFTINRRPLADTTISIEPQVYSGEALTPVPTVQFGQTKIVKGTDYTVTYKNNKDAGTAQAILTGKGNYTGSVTCGFYIAPKPVTVTVADASKTYGEDDPEFSAEVEGVVGADTVEYELVRADGEDAGEYDIDATGDAVQGNYEVTFVSGTLTINRAAQTVTASNETIAFDETIDLDAEASGGGKLTYKSSDTKIATVDANGKVTPVKVGEVSISITAEATTNYQQSEPATVTVTIEKADLAEATIAAVADQTYTGGEIKPSLSIKLGTKTLRAGTDYTVAYTNNTKVGTAHVTVTGEGNYMGSLSTTFTVARANISSATIAAIAEQTYTGAAIKPALSVKMGSTTLKSGTDYTVAYKNNTNAGTATITITGKGNYTGTKSVTFKIARIGISGATVSSIAEQGYTGSAIKPTPTVKVGSTTLKKDTDYTLSYKANTKVGTATVTITGKGSYTGTKSVTFKIVDWVGASRIPVSAQAKYTLLKGGYMRVKSGSKFVKSDSVVSISGWTVTGKKAGKTTLYLFDKSGKQLQTKTVEVFTAHAKTFEFESSVDRNYVLDIQGGSKKDGAQMIVYKRNNGANQKYTLYLQSDGTYGIKSVNSGRYLTVEAKTDKYVQQWGWKKGSNTDQRWRLTVDSANRATFVNVKAGKCFDVQGGKTTNSAKMIVWQSNNGLNQKWRLNQK